MAMRSGLFLPIFGELAEPAAVARLSHEAEEAGWHGVFVWDHVRWRQPVLAVANPWITLAAVATATQRHLIDDLFEGSLGPVAPPERGRGPGRCACRAASGYGIVTTPTTCCW
jgi:hypothetical protein